MLIIVCVAISSLVVASAIKSPSSGDTMTLLEIEDLLLSYSILILDSQFGKRKDITCAQSSFQFFPTTCVLEWYVIIVNVFSSSKFMQTLIRAGCARTKCLLIGSSAGRTREFRKFDCCASKKSKASTCTVYYHYGRARKR